MLIDKKYQETFIIDVGFSCQGQGAEKISKYQDFALEISPMRNTKARVISIGIDALLAGSLLTDYLYTEI